MELLMLLFVVPDCDSLGYQNQSKKLVVSSDQRMQADGKQIYAILVQFRSTLQSRSI